MRRGLFGAVAVAAVLGSAAMPAAARAAGQVSSANGSGEVKAISCGSGGTCAAGGDYFDASSKNQQAFVVTEIGGKWGAGVEVPGLAADNSKTSTITAISCAAGACTAGGWWQGAKLVFHAFVTTERNGKWSRLTSVLTAKRAAPHITGVRSVSCAGPKNCTVSGGRPAFMASEVNGKWGKAVEFPRHDKNGNVVVSCAAAGNCTAGWGNFVASDKHGRWGALRGVPNVTALGKEVSISSVSCTSTVNCAVAGIDRAGARDMVFVASETNGRWARRSSSPGSARCRRQTSRTSPRSRASRPVTAQLAVTITSLPTSLAGSTSRSWPARRTAAGAARRRFPVSRCQVTPSASRTATTAIPARSFPCRVRPEASAQPVGGTTPSRAIRAGRSWSCTGTAAGARSRPFLASMPAATALMPRSAPAAGGTRNGRPQGDPQSEVNLGVLAGFEFGRGGQQLVDRRVVVEAQDRFGPPPAIAKVHRTSASRILGQRKPRPSAPILPTRALARPSPGVIGFAVHEAAELETRRDTKCGTNVLGRPGMSGVRRETRVVA